MEKVSSVIPRLTAELLKNGNFEEQMVFWAYDLVSGKYLRENLIPKSFTGRCLYLTNSNKRLSQVFKSSKELKLLISSINDKLQRNCVTRIEIESTEV
ncbi:MAG: hypothetical protein JW737_05355 [Acidobacteria bacterium]|nr:hypothetical protein [Acidobacteriota bacterium]